MGRQATFVMDLQDLELLQFRLKQLPENVQNRIFRTGGRKAAKVFLDGAIALTPKSEQKPRRYRGKPHMRDVLTFRQRTYGRGAKSKTLFVIGPESKQAPHSHLVEKGTGKRYTQHKTEYKTLTEKITTRTGKVKFKRKKVSIGSKGFGFVSGQKYRGIMPAFHPLEKSFRLNSQAAMDVMRRAIQNGINRASK